MESIIIVAVIIFVLLVAVLIRFIRQQRTDTPPPASRSSKEEVIMPPTRSRIPLPDIETSESDNIEFSASDTSTRARGRFSPPISTSAAAPPPAENQPVHPPAPEPIAPPRPALEAESQDLDVPTGDTKNVKASDTSSGRDSPKPSPEASPVMFSAYPPKVAKRDEWQPMLAYIFREHAAQSVVADALQQLGEKQARFSQVTSMGKRAVREGAEVVARPTMAGFQFKPLEVKIGFYDDWQRFDFQLRAKDAPLNQFATGKIEFTVEGIIVADVPLSVYVGDESSVGEISSAVARMYKAIFCSYSHDDTQIVERVERAYKALGLDYLRDITTLKSGTHWSEEVLKLIDRADIFQLFWSHAAAASPYVKQEWEYALKLDRDSANFIRPVYWQQPHPPIPNALSHIHFAYQKDLGD